MYACTRGRVIGGLLIVAILVVGAISICAQTTWNVVPGESIQAAISGAANGDTIYVAAGTYTEQATLTPGVNLTIIGEGRDVVMWIAPAGGSCLVGNMASYTGAMSFDISGFTFNSRAEAAATYGAGIQIYRATDGPLTLSIHDNRFIEDRASGDSDHWGTSIFACHNRAASRDGAGNAPVLIYNNIDETWGGMTMSNAQAFDVFNNTFDGCSDAIYLGHGCPDAAGETFGDHHIYGNTFSNASDSLHPGSLTPAIDWQYYGSGLGTHLPSLIERNVFENNGTAIRFVMDTNMAYPLFSVTDNVFIGNTTHILALGTYAPTIDASSNWWGTDDPASVAPLVGDNVDFSPMLNSGDDGDPGTVGWQPDLTSITVHTLGQQLGTTGRIMEGVELVPADSTVYVASGTYSEQLTFTTAEGLTLSGNVASLPVVDGGVLFANSTAINGISLEYLYFTGAAASKKMVKMDAAAASINGFSLDNCIFDGESVADRIGIYGNKFAGTLSITNCEFKDIYGWTVFDLDGSYSGPPYGGTEFVLTSVTFANNHIHDCDGTISIRGNDVTPTATVNIYGNMVENIGGNDGGIGDQWAGIEVNHAAVANIYGNTIHDVEMGAWEGQAFQLWDIADLRLGMNVITDNAQGIWVFGGSPGGAYGHWSVPGGIVSLNSIVGNTEYGIAIDPGVIGGTLDATCNWWGSADGPTADFDSDGTPEYSGGGDKALGDIIFSPWLGENPDGNSSLPGVQLMQPLTIIVDDVGPIPGAKSVLGYVLNTVPGYLNRAIGTANTISGIDTIEVRHGTYDASEPITDGVAIVSEVGSVTDTILNGNMLSNAADTLIGRLRQGFTISGNVAVGAGTDASNIHINWNDIYGSVSNDGIGTLDAIFNYWGEDGPDTVGQVAINPILPASADTIIGYMDDHRLSAIDAIDFASLLDLNVSEREALAAVSLMNTFDFDEKGAAEIVEEYGAIALDRALAFAADYDEFLALLMGYAVEDVPTGGVAGGGEIETFDPDEPLPLSLVLRHPVTGEIIDDATVSYSVCRTLPDRTVEIKLFGVMRFDGDLAAYTFDVDTTGWEPGTYDIYLGCD
ncbi:MAG: hypothetical protein E4H08_09535, partial [Candidatus Atribacteria bacterium]